MRKPILIGAAFIVGGALVANAQPQYQPPPYLANPVYGQTNRAPATQPYPYSRPAPLSRVPPSWFYNPYTSAGWGRLARSRRALSAAECGACTARQRRHRHATEAVGQV